jgi:predicted ATPase
MWVKTFEVTGFLGREDTIEATFNRDLNILTGRNGAGKTSILKLMWYIMSGNILEALREVDFQKATLVTSDYSCTVYRLNRLFCRIDLTIDGETLSIEDIEDEDGDTVRSAEDVAADRLVEIGSSLFLPTFRRIEGGFTLGSGSRASSGIIPRPSRKNGVEEALEALSRKLSNGSHLFISAMSTSDISNLLQKHYTDLSESYNSAQRKMSQDIVEVIKHYQITGESENEVTTAKELLESIRAQIEDVDRSREQIMGPIEAIQKVTQAMLRHRGITLGRLTFGDAAEAISSESLSAGEKQMLSFIAYNGFNENSVFFIDEPELSLHVDWQRQLFATLLKQESTNQFIVATHSPFIYAKYPDKEILLSGDRGDAGVL